jgi:hypothetical protein
MGAAGTDEPEVGYGGGANYKALYERDNGSTNG